MRILAHRGSPGSTSVENTVPAVAAALAAGADGVEVDLRLTLDGVLAGAHDPDLTRLAGAPLAVADTEWDVLRAQADAAGMPLARVEWLLAAATGSTVVLEVKAPPPGPASRRRTAEALVSRLVELDRAGLPMEVTVSSFDAPLVAAVRRLAPVHLGLRTALLGRPGTRPSSLLRQALAAGHDEVHPHVTAVLTAPRSVATAHALGVAVVAWTVNPHKAVRRCAELGVDGIITDAPVLARLAVRSRGAAA